MIPLTPSQVEERLQSLSQWHTNKEHSRLKYIAKTVDFASALKLANNIGKIAEKADHHPDIKLSYGVVEVVLFTHSAGGVTEKDFALARSIDEITHASSS